MRVLGIDPGLSRTGWGVIEAHGSKVIHIAHGDCRTSSGPLATRLLTLFDGLSEVIRQHAPEVAAVEQTFVNSNGAATLKLGQARGIAMLAPATAGLPVSEYAPNAVKKAVVGVGHAGKPQIAHMLGVHFPGLALGSPDAADALAIALCHLHHAQSSSRLSAALNRAVGA